MPYLTPNDESGGYLCRSFRFREELAPYVSGALFHMADRWQWEQFGTLTVDEVLTLVQEMLDSYNASGDACMVGTIVEYITTNPPANVLPLDGSTYANSAWPLLASVLDGIYDNGDGTFTLPDARGRSLIATGTGGGLTLRSLGDRLGSETHILTEAEMPAHTHAEQDPGLVNVQSGVGATPLSDPGLPSQTGSTGSGQAHNNMHPVLAVHMGVIAA